MDEKMMEEGIKLILEGLGQDWENDQHLKDTPARAARGFAEIYRGYTEDPAELLERCFEEEEYDQMLTIGPIKCYSMCSHHLLPFTMDIYVGYIPDGKIVGISKFVRVARAISARLQVQERITEELKKVIQKTLKPKGVMVLVKNSQHMCMTMRGVKSDTAGVSTSAFCGAFEDEKTRQEFLEIIRGD